MAYLFFALLFPHAGVVRAREESMNDHRLSLFLWRVSCGFPSPADDYVETALDLNELVIAHPAATFYVRVSEIPLFKHLHLCLRNTIIGNEVSY